MQGRLAFAFVMLSACGAACGSSGGDGPADAPPVDSPPSADARVDATLDALPSMCVPGYLDLCNESPPSIALAVAGAATVNTDTDPRCRVRSQVGGPEVCVFYYTKIEIPAGASLFAFGSRALAMASTEELIIDGTLDVGSLRSRTQRPAGSLVACAGTAPKEDLGGGGGGAGGTNATQGGPGGLGDTDNGRNADGTGTGGIASAAAAFSVLRGGCPGQKGGNSAVSVGGNGGGAIYLSGKTVTIGGRIQAQGAAGTGGGADVDGGGGGGGGAGGTIVIQGSLSVTVNATAVLLATGGGGGQGGTSTSVGESGSDPVNATPAPGGDNANSGGNGGVGGVTAAGANGQNSTGGGGGGGGSGGFIRILSPTRTLTGALIAPAPFQAN